MNRKNQNQNSSDRILKSKYLEKQKPKYPPSSISTSKKVMLTDLCPQQKLKIGELIKVNESRRQEILELTQEMNEIRQKFTICHSKLMGIEQEFEAKEQECIKLTRQIQKLQEKSIEMEIMNSKLTLENKDMKEKIDKLASISKENRSCQTQSTSKADFSSQTKKNKTKNREIQVEQQELMVKTKSHSNKHTKSFDRIIKDKEKSQKNSYSRSHNEIAYSQNSQNRNEEQDDDLQNEQMKEAHEMLVEERLNDLAKQWLQLKQKNVSHLKVQYENSKAKFFKEEMHSPKEFTCEDLNASDRNQAQDNQIDQNQLNNLLKSKNFSASRLLTAKGMNQSQNSRKASVNDKNQKPRYEQKSVSISYTLKQPKLKMGIEHPKKIQKTPLYEKYTGRNNFYESDFMELVDSLNE